MSTKVEIEFNKIKNLKHQKLYLALIRQMLLHYQTNYMMDKVWYKDDYNTIINHETLAKRLGFIAFKELDLNRTYSFKLENSSSQARYVYSNELRSQDRCPVDESQLILILPGNSCIEFEASFVTGNGLDHARFSKVEGYRMNQNDASYLVEFQIRNQSYVDVFNRLKSDER